MSLSPECPLCAASNSKQSLVTTHVYGGRPDQAFYRCKACDIVYLNPGLSPEEEAHFYAAEFEGFMGSRSGTGENWEKPNLHVQQNQPQLARRMKYLAPRLPVTGRILEIGCSSGFMLYPLAETKYDCVGIEPSGVFADFVRSKGIPCFNSAEDFEKDSLSSEGFDVVMHYFVLEHIADPRAFISKQLNYLKPGGKLIMEIPNVADPLVTVYDIDAFEKFYWSVAHHWYFSEASLRFLLEPYGLKYEIILDQRYDFSNHMVWAKDGKPGGMGRFVEALGGEFDDQYRETLIRSGYCDTLIAVLTK